MTEVSGDAVSTQTAVLIDGTEVPLPTAKTIFLQLQNLKKDDLFTLFDLAMKCIDDTYSFPTIIGHNSVAVLKQQALIDNEERVHNHVRAIVINSIKNRGDIESDGLSVELQNPISRIMDNTTSASAWAWNWCQIL